MSAKRKAPRTTAGRPTRAPASKRAGAAKRTAGRPASTSKSKTKSKATSEARSGTASAAELAPQQMVELVDRYLAAFNRGDVEAVLALYHPSASMEDPVGYTPAKGLRAIGAVYAGGFRQGVQIRLDGQVRCAGGALAFPVVARTAKATLFAVNVFELARDGRIARMRAYWGPYNVVGEIAVRG